MIDVERHQRIASVINGYRVIPRLLVGMYGYICWETFQWFTALPDPSSTQATFASIIWGASAAWFGFYTNTGK